MAQHQALSIPIAGPSSSVCITTTTATAAAAASSSRRQRQQELVRAIAHMPAAAARRRPSTSRVAHQLQPPFQRRHVRLALVPERILNLNGPLQKRVLPFSTFSSMFVPSLSWQTLNVWF
jgi:hypothetical protein